MILLTDGWYWGALGLRLCPFRTLEQLRLQVGAHLVRE